MDHTIEPKIPKIEETFNGNKIIQLKELIEKKTKVWSVLIRISNKDALSTFKKDNQKNYRFNFKIIDKNETEIDCISFGDSALKFFNLIEYEALYYISNGVLRVNDFTKKLQIYLNKFTNIKKCEIKHSEIHSQSSFNPIDLKKIINKSDNDEIGKFFFQLIFLNINISIISLIKRCFGHRNKLWRRYRNGREKKKNCVYFRQKYDGYESDFMGRKCN